jgi:hypothetical protein
MKKDQLINIFMNNQNIDYLAETKFSEKSNAIDKPNLVKRFSFFFKNRFKQPQTRYFLGLIFLIVLVVFLYPKFFLKEELSEFELNPQIFDAAGIDPGTSFILKSSANLSPTVVRKHLRFEPEVEYEIKKTGTGSAIFEIKSLAFLEEDKVYSIIIDEGPIAARTYSWAYQVKAPFQVITSLPRDKATWVPTNTGIEITFNRENIINPQSSFQISPSVNGEFKVYRNVLVFVPRQELAEKTIYTIKIKSDLRAEGTDDSLSEDVEIRFETGSKYSSIPRPYFNFSKKFWEFKPETEGVFEVYYSNLPGNTVPLTIYKMDSADEFINEYKNSLAQESIWSHYHAYKAVGFSNDKKVFESDVPFEEQSGVRFIRMPQKLSEGFYIAQVLVGNELNQSWFQVTPIAGFSAISGSKTFLWFKDLNSGKGIANVDVSFEGKSFSRTNNDGVTMFDTPQQLISGDNEDYWSGEPSSHFYLANYGEKKLAVPVENERSYFSKVRAPNSWWEYFSTDKTIYLPTDKVHFWGIVKQRNGADVKGEKVIVQLTNPFWERTSEEDITVYGEIESVISDFYTLTGAISFSDINPGLYQLSVKRGNEIIVSETINVKTYIKPAYRLILTADKNTVFAGETITYKVKAEFFEGTPVANLKLKYSGYFNDHIDGEVTLDKKGEGSFVIETDYQNEDTYWPRYFGMTVSPAIAEEGEIDSSFSVLVFGPNINLRSEQEISERTSRFNLSLKRVILERIEKGDPWWVSDNYLGDPVSNWNITADVVEIIYHKKQIDTGYDAINKTTYPIYRYSTEDKLIKQDVLTTNSSGNTRYEWTAEKGKTYRITFTSKDARGRIVQRSHYVYGGSFSYFGSYDSRGLDLENIRKDKNNYKLGDAIRLQMRGVGGNTLESKPGSFIFLRMVNGISSYQISDSPDYEDTFKDSYVPNVEIIGVWFTGSRFTNSYSINLPFDSDERRLNVEIIKDKERYRPRDKVNLEIKVTDKNNNPKQAEVNIAGIDEAVFSLNPIEKDITNTLYKNIWTPLLIRSSHFVPFESGAELGACFVSGTMVWTPKGEKPIEELRVGDEVFTRESESSEKIIKTKIKQVGSYLTKGYLVVNNNLRLTYHHTLFVNNSWKLAGEIKIGDVLITKKGEPERVDSLDFISEWRTVYNIELEGPQTYFADGIYVHNQEKGGAMERSDFRDIAIYESVRTDSQGRARVSFNVPDNLTSWRITAQGVTKDLFAGKSIDFVPVGLPFFVDATINRTYLAGDNFILRIRTFGTANIMNDISYTIESETLSFEKIEQKGESVIEIPLGKLTAGKHKIKVSAKSNGFSDTIIRDLNVVTSYFSQNVSEFYELSLETANIKGATRKRTTLLFSSYERGRFHNILHQLSYQNGPRLDQKLTGILAKVYLNRYFDEANEVEEINILNYQYQGGATLLPYSDNDLELSAKFANLIQGEEIMYNSESLKQYLYSSLSDRKSDLSRISTALYGLSVFKEPVLITTQNIKKDRGLELKDKIYIALALDNLGAKEEARSYYRTEIRPKLTSRRPYVFVNHFKNNDENIIATALVASLTASLSEPETDLLGQYAIENSLKENLKNFEVLLYLKNTLPRLKADEVSFSYEFLNKKGSKKFKGNEVFHLDLSPEELSAFKVSDIKGRIGMVSVFEKEVDPAKMQTDKTISVSRTYSVNDQQTTRFEEGDLVKISLEPIFRPNSLEGAYQVVDYLPSGLRAATNIQSFPFREDGNYPYYPSSIEDQKVTFVVWSNFSKKFFYYARVVSKGDYKAEPVIIQSLKSTEILNTSKENKIIIR